MTKAIERDHMQYDVVIVGAGPAGLAAAIKLKQLAQNIGTELSVCVLEKGAEVGVHILSGAVIDPVALDELLPNWKELGAPITRTVTEDLVYFFTRKNHLKLMTPPSFQNRGNYLISLGELTRWMAEQAENLGVEVYSGFSATEILFHTDGSVKGIATGDMGVDKNGQVKEGFQRGIELWAQQTIFSEGCRGSLTKQLVEAFSLANQCQVQTYGIGIKEIWEVPATQCKPGRVMHSVGWPLDHKTYGGSFIYHLDHNQIALGFVVGLDYENPYLSPFEEFQRFKTHPKISSILKGGRRIAYGARALSEGGLQSLPKLSFRGGALAGDCAGFLNMPRIKGIHTAIKSGMLTAEAVFSVLKEKTDDLNANVEAVNLQKLFEQSWLYRELYEARNIRPAFKWGLFPAMFYSVLEQYCFKGRLKWTIKHRGADHQSLHLAKDSRPIDYPKPDNVLTFDRLSSIALAHISHNEDQPSHLILTHPKVMIDVNLKNYASPETRYCPAAVYEIVMKDGEKSLHINSQNCIHCKTCDIKDPTQNITWVCPEGGNGPNYGSM